MAVVSKKQARQANKAAVASAGPSKTAPGKASKPAKAAPVDIVEAQSEADDDEEGDWSDEEEDEDESDEDEDNGGVSQKGLERLMALVGDDLDDIARAQLGLEGGDEDEDDEDEAEDDEDDELGSDEEDEEEEDDEDEDVSYQMSCHPAVLPVLGGFLAAARQAIVAQR